MMWKTFRVLDRSGLVRSIVRRPSLELKLIQSKAGTVEIFQLSQTTTLTTDHSKSIETFQLKDL